MPWSEHHKILFIHIPKTGGTSLEDAFGMIKDSSGYGVIDDRAMQHYNWNEYSLFKNSNFDKFLKISIVRNPYTRFISEYYWCEIEGMGYKSNQSINEFLTSVENIVRNRNFNETRFHDHFIPQYEFIYNTKEKMLIVDNLFYFEQMGQLRDFLCRYWKWLPHRLKSNYATIKLTKSQQQRIYKLYEKDFTLFGYQKYMQKDKQYNARTLTRLISPKFIFCYAIYKLDRYVKKTIKFLKTLRRSVNSFLFLCL